MVTLRNLHNESLYSKSEMRLLLDNLILIVIYNEHATSVHGDMLKYVHEKSACYNICEKGIGERSGYKAFEAKLMVNTEITERRESTCLLNS